MVRQNHWLSGYESEQTQDIGEHRGAWHAAAHGVIVIPDLVTEQQQYLYFYL